MHCDFLKKSLLFISLSSFFFVSMLFPCDVEKNSFTLSSGFISNPLQIANNPSGMKFEEIDFPIFESSFVVESLT